MNITDLLHRAALMRATAKVQGAADCRVPLERETDVQGQTTDVVELGYWCSKGAWPPSGEPLVPACGTEGCVMHLEVKDEDARDEALVAAYMPRQSLADLFRAGRARGWFKGGGGYAP